MKHEISYATTDLVIQASFDLAPIADELVELGLVLYYAGPFKDGLWSARFTSSEWFLDPDSHIADMLTTIEALDQDATSLWAACNERTFDIAYNCGDGPWAFNQQLLPTTLVRIATAQAGIVITIYPLLDTEAVMAAIAILKKDKWVKREIGKYNGHGTHLTDSSSLKNNQAEVKVSLNGQTKSVIVHCLMELSVDGEWGMKEIFQKEVRIWPNP